MADIEKDSLSVKQLLSARGVSAELAKRIQDADADGNGEISIEELVVVLQSEQKAKQDVKLFRNIIILLAVSLIILIAATAGVTYGMVYALKDTNIQSSIMVTKSSNVPVSTGVATNSTDLSNLYMVSSVEELVSVDKIVLAPADNKSVSVYHVASINLIPGTSAIINTTDGRTIVVDSSGIYEVASVTPTGRRLLYETGSAFSSSNSATSNDLYSLGNSIVGLASGFGGSAAGAITTLSSNITSAVNTVSNFATNTLNSVNSSISNFISMSKNAVNGSNPCCGAEGGLQQAVAQLNAVYPNATTSVSQVVGLVNQIPRNASQICSTSEVKQLISTINGIVSNLNGALNQNGSNGLTSLIKPAVASTQCCQNVASYIGQLKTMDSSFQTLQMQLTTACTASNSGKK